MAASRICSVAGCGKKRSGKGLCSAHYQRFLRHGDPEAGGPERPSRGKPEEFLKSVVLSHEGDDCLEWPFAKLDMGYGIIARPKGTTRTRLVHRLVCEIVNGPADEMDAAHSCGNTGCCNPKHIRWATHVENMADREDHGTDLRGERSGTAKLTDAKVLQIRAMHGKVSQQRLAEMFSVTISNISMITSRRTWSHL